MRPQSGARRKIKVDRQKKKTVRRTKKASKGQETPFKYSAVFNAVAEKKTQTSYLHEFRLPTGLDDYLDKIEEERDKESGSSTIEEFKDIYQ